MDVSRTFWNVSGTSPKSPKAECSRVFLVSQHNYRADRNRSAPMHLKIVTFVALSDIMFQNKIDELMTRVVFFILCFADVYLSLFPPIFNVAYI